MVKYSITDTGIGIEKKNLNKIFSVFFREGKLDEEKGEGIGLSIVKRIVDKHCGQIKVDSIVGEGTTISVYLPKMKFKER